MKQNFIFEYARKLIAEGKLGEAIKVLLEPDANFSGSDRNSLILLSGTFNAAIAGRALVTPEFFAMQMAQIRHGLLNLLDSVERLSDIQLPVNSTEELEKIIGTNNLAPIASLKAQIQWLEKGLKASKSVCKVQLANGGGSGTGFVAIYKGEKYLFTNWHVLKTKDMAANAKVIFNYETDSSGQYKQTKEYDLDADNYISSPYGKGDNDLDYARVKIKELETKWGELNFNINFSLPVNGEKAPIAIIQHPEGKPKKISIVDANVEDIKHGVRVYHTADTKYGSSGSPIFDKDWNVIALHHAREIDKDLNKGILFSRIFKDMETKGQEMVTA